MLQLFASGGNYYHWMHDVIQKLYLILDILPNDIKFIVPKNLKPWQRKTLTIIGIQEHQMVYFASNEIWEIEELYFSPINAALGFDIPGSNQWIQEHFYRYCLEDSGGEQPRERILISRSEARGRKITNESEIEELLEEYGFKRYVLEQMSLEEQVKLFARAEIVVSPHGAGLTNLMFSPAGTQVLEIFASQDIPSLCFWSLSHAMAHQYCYLLGETIENPQALNQPNVLVVPKKLRQSLDLLLNEKLPIS